LFLPLIIVVGVFACYGWADHFFGHVIDETFRRRMSALSPAFIGCHALFRLRGMMEELSGDGFVETYQAVRTRVPHETQASRARARLQLYGGGGNYQLYARGTAELDFERRNNRAELDAAYVDRVGDGWDLRLGRQVVIWGRADGLRIVDRVSPSDLSESLTRELDEVRLGIDALRFRKLGVTS
jgi:hypothetical protein